MERFTLISPEEMIESEAQEAQPAVEDRLHISLAAEPAGLAVLDDQLRYVQINETLARINGVPVEEHLGKTIRQVLPQLAPMVEPVLHKILTTGTPALNLRLSGETASEPGVTHHWMLSFIPLPGNNGRPKGISALVVDVTNQPQPDAEATQLLSDPNHVSSNGHAMQGAVALRKGIGALQDLTLALSTAVEVLQHAQVTEPAPKQPEINQDFNLNDEVRRFETDLIERALRQTGGNQKKAARLLGVKHTTLHTKIKRYKIAVP